jgi:predicted amidohydrolase
MNRRQFVKLAAAAGTIVAAPGGGAVKTEAQAPPALRPLPKNTSVKVLGIPFVTQEAKAEANVKAACDLIRQEHAKSPVDLVVLPELFTCGYAGQDMSAVAEPADGPSARAFTALSHELDILIGFGFAESTGKKLVYNSWLLIEPNAKPHLYRKTHLHPTPSGGVTNEREMFLPGETLEPFETRLGTIGVMICYDGCFVEVPRTLALKGADFILWPSRSGCYLANQALPRARSLDNSITTVLVEGGQAGPHMPLESFSAAYSEKGSKLVSQKGDSNAFRITVDLEAGRKLRLSAESGALSLYHPRRPELYAAVAQNPGLYQKST